MPLSLIAKSDSVKGGLLQNRLGGKEGEPGTCPSIRALDRSELTSKRRASCAVIQAKKSCERENRKV